MQDPDFDQSWREFADQDAQVQAPRRVRHLVMAAWDDEHDRVRAKGLDRGSWLALATVAALIALTVASVVIRRAPATQGQRDGRTASARVPEVPADSNSGPVMRLVADQAFENEPLTIVRVRVPRSSLRAMGIALVEPEASSLVDLDVVVGSDGLPRAIQRIRFVLDGSVQ